MSNTTQEKKPGGKIPCSLAIITSKADGLEPRLKALSEFGEIIICHGNAPEENLEIARELGAIIVKQYDTDEPLLNSMTDKAAVRQRAMDASTLPWRFFMDRDDTLTPETIAEIRAITTNPNPTHLVWRMPGRIFIENQDGSLKEIKYEAAYPAYQTRLVHEKVGARFRGLVHERIEFDRKKFPVGTMQNSYDFQWPRQRVANYWKYLDGYATREVDVLEFTTFAHFAYWMLYRRTRTIIGYLVRITLMYLKHGTRNAMPLRIELLIVGYHIKILFAGTQRYITTRPWILFLKHWLSGKSASFTRVYLASRRFEAYGRILDIGGTSYMPAMHKHRWHRITAGSKDMLMASGEPAWQAEYFDTVLLFDPTSSDQEIALSRVFRALRPGGSLIGMANSKPDAFKTLCKKVGFTTVEVWNVGYGAPQDYYAFKAAK